MVSIYHESPSAAALELFRVKHFCKAPLVSPNLTRQSPDLQHLSGQAMCTVGELKRDLGTTEVLGMQALFSENFLMVVQPAAMY